MRFERFAVIGHPIGHTMSPYIHKNLFAMSGLNPSYEVLDIEDLDSSVEMLKEYDGLNITIPHKQAIVKQLKGMDDRAWRFGSVNTVKIEDRKMWGYTTDGLGCVMALSHAGVDFSGDVLILGSGGAARAIAFQLKEEGASVDIAARNGDKAQKIIDDLSGGGRAISLLQAEAESKSYSLLINATSVGMVPNSGFSPVSEKVVSRCKGVFDAVYNPHKTKLLEIAQGLGKKTVYGIDMLVFQAVEAHRIWYKACFNQDKLWQLCADSARERARLFDAKG